VTRLATAGASVPETAEVTGHSLMDVASILDRHYYLGERAALAEAAIRKLEKSERRTKVSNLPHSGFLQHTDNLGGKAATARRPISDREVCRVTAINARRNPPLCEIKILTIRVPSDTHRTNQPPKSHVVW
jgi:hypothetical protein